MVGKNEAARKQLSQTVLQAIFGDFHEAAVTLFEARERSPGLLFSAVFLS